MRKRVLFLAAVVCALGAPAARALTVTVPVTPKSLKQDRRTFTVRTKEVGPLTEFTVTIEASQGQLSPFLFPDLHLNTKELTLGYVRVEGKREGDKVTYWFRVAPQAVAHSTFELGEQNYGPVRDAKGTPIRDAAGKPRYEMFIGGIDYELKLADFVNAGP
jgi:hypothetical protein